MDTQTVVQPLPYSELVGLSSTERSLTLSLTNNRHFTFDTRVRTIAHTARRGRKNRLWFLTGHTGELCLLISLSQGTDVRAAIDEYLRDLKAKAKYCVSVRVGRLSACWLAASPHSAKVSRPPAWRVLHPSSRTRSAIRCCSTLLAAPSSASSSRPSRWPPAGSTCVRASQSWVGSSGRALTGSTRAHFQAR